jgi:hypothetical protein
MATRVDRRYNHKRIAVDPFDPVRIDQFTDRGERIAIGVRQRNVHASDLKDALRSRLSDIDNQPGSQSRLPRSIPS